jgi:hypothetical protein
MWVHGYSVYNSFNFSRRLITLRVKYRGKMLLLIYFIKYGEVIIGFILLKCFNSISKTMSNNLKTPSHILIL